MPDLVKEVFMDYKEAKWTHHKKMLVLIQSNSAT